MAKNRLQLRNLIRDNILAWPEHITALNGDITAVATSIVVTDSTAISPRQLLEIGTETIMVRAVDTATHTLTVLRGYQGTTAATHSNGDTVNVFPWWGWTDSQLNALLDISFDFCWPKIWYGKYYANTVSDGAREFGAPDAVRFPEGEQIIELEFYSTADTKWVPCYRWAQLNDRIKLDVAVSGDTQARMYCAGKHDKLTDDTTTLFNDDPVPTLVAYTTKLALERLLANRTRYTEYSAALNDRASTPDELARQVYHFYNQAILARDEAARPFPPGFANIRRSS